MQATTTISMMNACPLDVAKMIWCIVLPGVRAYKSPTNPEPGLNVAVHDTNSVTMQPAPHRQQTLHFVRALILARVFARASIPTCGDGNTLLMIDALCVNVQGGP